MKIERFKINEESAAKLKTDYKAVDRVLTMAATKLNIARISGDFLYETAVVLGYMCQKLFNELEELRENKSNTEKTGNEEETNERNS